MPGLDDDISNMSPERLQEMQKKNCIFCHIISGRVSSKKIYEDDKCIAILDINPCNPGHVLLLPKDHYAVLPQMPDDLVKHLFKVSKGISNAQLKALQAGGTNIFLANGVSAGQKAPHFMFHIIPRKENDGIRNFDFMETSLDAKAISEAEAKIRYKLNMALGITQEEVIDMDKAEDLTKPKVVHAEFNERREEEEEPEEDDQEEHYETDSNPDMDEISVERKLGIKDEDSEDNSEADDDSKDVDLDDISSVILGGKK